MVLICRTAALTMSRYYAAYESDGIRRACVLMLTLSAVRVTRVASRAWGRQPELAS